MSVKLTWSDPNFDANNEEGLRIYRSETPMTPGAMPPAFTTLQADVTEYTFAENLPAYYRVGAYRAGYEILSDELFYSPDLGPSTTPAVDFDFVNQIYLVDGISTPFASLFTFTGGQGGTYYDAAGVMQVAGVDELRFDHDPVTLEPRGPLIESGVYNYLGPSEDLTNVNFVKSGVTVSPNVATTPRGTATGDKLVEDGSTGLHEISFTPSGSSSGQYWTESAFIQAAGRTKFEIDITGANGTKTASFDLAAKTFDPGLYTGYLEELPGGWFRVGFTAFPGGSTFAHTWKIRILDDAGNASYTGDGSSGLIVWGLQSVPRQRMTSYIPSTANYTNFRASDVLTLPLSAMSYNADEGTWFVEYQSRDISAQWPTGRAWLVEVTDDTTNFQDNIMLMQSFGYPLYFGAISGLVTRDNLERANEYTLGTDDAFPDLVPDGGWFPPLKAAMTYKKNQVQVVGTNQALTQDLDCLLPIGLTRATFGGSVVPNTNRHLSGYVRNVKYYGRILSPAELDTLTI